jgi:uncharacterized protein (DUF608 family)
MSKTLCGRREFVNLCAQAAGVLGLGKSAAGQSQGEGYSSSALCSGRPQLFNGSYEGERLSQIAFPMGGIGAGMICLEGTGALSKVSLRHRPDLNSEPRIFAAVTINGPERISRVLEGPVPSWKLRPQFPGESEWSDTPVRTWGLPRFQKATFQARFPFATVRLIDERLPVEAGLTGWSPFAPGDADGSSLPVAAIEYTFTNRISSPVHGMFSFSAENFMASPANLLTPMKSPSRDRIQSTAGGFVLYGPGAADCPWDEGWCAAWVEDPNVKVNHAWFRGGALGDDGLLDSLQMLWRDVQSGACYARAPLLDQTAPGASLFVPFTLGPGETTTIALRLAWYVPKSNLFEPKAEFNDDAIVSRMHMQTHQPWYAGRFSGINDVIAHWQSNYRALRQAAENFTQTFYDSTLPPEAIEAVAANLTILKSPTVLRQIDGRLWGWEGCLDSVGSCYGSSNHVWNYAQAVAHLFPDLERTLRETELGPNLGKNGIQACRTALPIRDIGDTKNNVSAADGQLGGIVKAYRDWRISGDSVWLLRLWPRILESLNYCIATWDPAHRGWIEEPHLNTFDVEFWGADSMCTTLYLAALKSVVLMGQFLHVNVDQFSELLNKGIRRTEEQLFNGEYFYQRTEWRSLRTPFPRNEHDPLSQFPPIDPHPEALDLVKREGPSYQYGHGCLSDGLLGIWLSLVSGIDELLEDRNVKCHLSAVYRHNFKQDIAECANVGRSQFANDNESGLLVCTWPNGGRPSLPFSYADEVWTGTEYQVASHLMAWKSFARAAAVMTDGFAIHFLKSKRATGMRERCRLMRSSKPSAARASTPSIKYYTCGPQ